MLSLAPSGLPAPPRTRSTPPGRLPPRHAQTGEPAPLISEEVNSIIQANAGTFDAAMRYDRDFDFDYFGFKTLERSYLLRIDGEVAERPQQMYMRVCVGIHKADIAAALESYELMSQRYFTHATPTLFNGGTPRPQLSSCFLLKMKDDSIDGCVAAPRVHARRGQGEGGGRGSGRVDALARRTRLIRRSHRVPHTMPPHPTRPRPPARRQDLRDAEELRVHLQVRGRHRPVDPQHPRDELVHPRHQRLI